MNNGQKYFNDSPLYGPNKLAISSLLLDFVFACQINHKQQILSEATELIGTSIMLCSIVPKCLTLLLWMRPSLLRAHEHHHGDRRLQQLLAQTPQGCGFHEPAVHEIYQLQAEQEERVARIEEERFALQQRQYEQQQGGCSISFGGGGGSAWNPGDGDDTGGGGGSDGDNDGGGGGGGGNWNSQVTIPTYVHTVYRTNGDGFLSDSTLNQSIQVANSLLSSAGFQINVISINRVQNDDWFQAESGSTQERDMQARLKRGGLNTLNIYFKLAVSGSSRFCGYAYLAEDASAVGNGDGVTIDINCVLDRTTVAHEVGTFMIVRTS
jgi:hypothetical protein